MSNSVLALSFDTADAAAIAQFWAAVLDRPIADGATAQFAAIGVVDAELTGPRLMFHQVPEGKRVKNRLHLDIMTDDLDAETERLLGLGATVLNRASTIGLGWTTLADPDGNEFDLIAR
jgi:predicted enzyme related to lactoylglutathione lyase